MTVSDKFTDHPGFEPGTSGLVLLLVINIDRNNAVNHVHNLGFLLYFGVF